MLPRVWWGRRNWGRREFREIQRTICQRRRRRRTYRSTCLPGSDADRCRIPTHLVRPDNFKHGRKALWKGQLSGISTVTFPNNGRASPSSDPQGSPEGSEACSSFDRVPVGLRTTQGCEERPSPRECDRLRCSRTPRACAVQRAAAAARSAQPAAAGCRPSGIRCAAESSEKTASRAVVALRQAPLRMQSA